jgi:glycosyltransferase involved in cell wall biosynthesis
VLDSFGRLLTGPVQSWDAVICTSRAVAASVNHVLDAWGEFLAQRLDAKPRKLVQLPVIPLGVDAPSLAAAGSDPALRKKWRDRLGIGANDLCVLYVGRLSYHAKAHPLPMYMALQEAALTTNRRIHLLQAGWFANVELEKQFKDMAASFCPAVNAIFVDGRSPDVRAEIWSCGDVFVSLSDNIQETFGLSPVEAMAAGLPVVASDWDGYRDTVRDGIDGFLVPTLLPPAGAGEIMAYRFQSHADSYDRYLGHVSQCTAVDVGAAGRAFARLFADDNARRQMGEAGRKRAETAFDWSVVIKAYQDLWAELARRRRTDSEIAARTPGKPAHPLRDDPFALFAGYPTHRLEPDQFLAVRDGADMARLNAVMAFQANTFAAEFLAPKERCEIVLRTLKTFGPRRVRDLIQLFPKPHQEGVARTLGWLAKAGFLDFNITAPAIPASEAKQKEPA